ncbi:aquaporin [soil metagenome]
MKLAPATYIRWILAEFLGTAFLASAVAVLVTAGYQGVPGYDSVFVPFIIGIVITVLVMCFGWVSGSHFNPAITISQALFRKIPVAQAGIYIGSQLAGAFVGVKLANLLLGRTSLIPDATSTPIVVGEFVGTMILSFAVTLVVTKRVPSAAAALFLGGSITLALLLSVHTGGGVINPAVAFGLGGYSLTFLVTPIIGAICGAAIGVLFDETATTPREV